MEKPAAAAAAFVLCALLRLRCATQQRARRRVLVLVCVPMEKPAAVTALSIEQMLALVRERLTLYDERLEKVQQLHSELHSRPDLFDDADFSKIQQRHTALQQERQSIQSAYDKAAECYKSSITDLKRLATERADFLERLDDLLTADPAILDFLSQKQAHYNDSIQQIEDNLTRCIHKELVPYTEIK